MTPDVELPPPMDPVDGSIAAALSTPLHGSEALPVPLLPGSVDIAPMESVPPDLIGSGTILPPGGRDLPPADAAPGALADGNVALQPDEQARPAAGQTLDPALSVAGGSGVGTSAGAEAPDTFIGTVIGTDPTVRTATQGAGVDRAAVAVAGPSLPPGDARQATGDQQMDAQQGRGEQDPRRGQTGDRHAASARSQSGMDAGSRLPGISFERLDLPPPPTTMPSPLTPAAATNAVSTTGLPGASLPLTGDPAQWPNTLSRHLAGLVTRGVNTADIRLAPPNLGHLEVRITVQQDQASVWVASANADVREALQHALPRLDSLLDNLGIRLADASVSDQQFDGFFEQQSRSDQDADAEAGGSDSLSHGHRPPERLGLLDYWA